MSYTSGLKYNARGTSNSDCHALNIPEVILSGLH